MNGIMKTCKREGCSNPVFSHLYCKYDQNLRTDSKWEERLLKIKEGNKDYHIALQRHNSIKVMSEPRKKKIMQQAKSDAAFYTGLQFARIHVCWKCKDYLGEQLSNYNFHHILEKAKYPQFRYEPKNIILLCLHHHSECHQSKGKPEWYKDLIEETKKKLLDPPPVI